MTISVLISYLYNTYKGVHILAITPHPPGRRFFVYIYWKQVRIWRTTHKKKHKWPRKSPKKQERISSGGGAAHFLKINKQGVVIKGATKFGKTNIIKDKQNQLSSLFFTEIKKNTKGHFQCFWFTRKWFTLPNFLDILLSKSP